MDGAFRSPSPVPFVVVMEATLIRERKRNLVREHRVSVGSDLLSQQPQLCNAQDFAGAKAGRLTPIGETQVRVT